MRYSIALAAILLATSAAAQDIRVIDGDTFELDGQAIRLWGIDAPEMDQTCDESGLPFAVGQQVAERVRELLDGFGFCDPVSTDLYGRAIANCFLRSGTYLNSHLVLRGWAWDYAEYSGGEVADIEARAQRFNAGVHGMDCAPPWEWREWN